MPSVLELTQHGDCDDGEYTVAVVRAGRVVAAVTVEDGIFGQKVEVLANGRTVCSEKVDWL